MTTESKYPTLEFIESDQLRKIIQTKEVGKDYLIVDVRDDDYVVNEIEILINLMLQEAFTLINLIIYLGR